MYIQKNKRLRRCTDHLTEPCLTNGGSLQESPTQRRTQKGVLSCLQVSLNLTRSLAKCSAHTRRLREGLFTERKTDQDDPAAVGRAPLTSGSSRVHRLAWRHSVPAARTSGSLTFLLLSEQERAQSTFGKGVHRERVASSSQFRC